VNAHDTSAYEKLFADNIIWVPADFLATDKMEIKNALQKNFDVNKPILYPGEIEIEVRGDFAYAFSTDFELILKPKEGDEELKFKASAIWLLRKQDNGWKIFRQVYNTRDYNP
jgi:ketosteroid isomerase-like protein